jgi:hypothetical protein
MYLELFEVSQRVSGKLRDDFASLADVVRKYRLE